MPWLAEDDPETDSDDESVKESRCVHRPRQSRFFHRNKDRLQLAQQIAAYFVYGATAALTLLSLYIAIEEGRFPFNISAVARVAYSRHYAGKASIALLVVGLLSLAFVGLRSAAVKLAQSGCYKLAVDGLQGARAIDEVRPKAPKE